MRMGRSGSLRDHPNELTESRNELFAMIDNQLIVNIPIERSSEGVVHGGVCREGPWSRKSRPREASAGTMRDGVQMICGG